MPRGTPNTKPTPLLIELQAFGRTVKVDELPYEQIVPTYADAGYTYRLLEIDALPCYDGTTLMRFDVMVGKRAEDETVAFERVDTLSIKMGGQPGPVSVAARLAANESVIYLLTGRLPAPKNLSGVVTSKPGGPQTDVAYPEQTVAMDDADQELVNDNDESVPVVARREPDGLPIFVDLYAVGAPTRAVIDAVLDECAQFLETASAEQVVALAAKNDGMKSFLKDLGEPADTEELLAMVKRRRDALAEAALPKEGAAMRRRAAGARAAN